MVNALPDRERFSGCLGRSNSGATGDPPAHGLPRPAFSNWARPTLSNPPGLRGRARRSSLGVGLPRPALYCWRTGALR